MPSSILFIFRNKKSNAFSELFKYDYLEEKIDLIYSGKLMSHYCFISKNKIFAYLENENENVFLNYLLITILLLLKKYYQIKKTILMMGTHQ